MNTVEYYHNAMQHVSLKHVMLMLRAHAFEAETSYNYPYCLQSALLLFVHCERLFIS